MLSAAFRRMAGLLSSFVPFASFLPRAIYGGLAVAAPSPRSRVALLPKLCPLDRLKCDAPPEEAGVAHQGGVLGIDSAALESRHIRLLCAKSGCDLLLTEPLTLSFRSKLPNQPPSFDGCLHKLWELRVHRGPPRDEVV